MSALAVSPVWVSRSGICIPLRKEIIRGIRSGYGLILVCTQDLSKLNNVNYCKLDDGVTGELTRKEMGVLMPYWVLEVCKLQGFVCEHMRTKNTSVTTRLLDTNWWGFAFCDTKSEARANGYERETAFARVWAALSGIDRAGNASKSALTIYRSLERWNFLSH